MRHSYGVVFCGGSPAAIGPIVCAAVKAVELCETLPPSPQLADAGVQFYV